MQNLVQFITHSRVWKSFFRHGWPDNPLDRSLVMTTNIFFHLHPVKVHKNTLRPDLLFAHRLWYRTRFDVPASLADRSWLIVFPANNLNTTLYVNGQFCGFDKNPFARLQFDITAAVKPGDIITYAPPAGASPALGAIFVSGQVWEYAQLVAEGMPIEANSYASASSRSPRRNWATSSICKAFARGCCKPHWIITRISSRPVPETRNRRPNWRPA